MDSLRHNFKPNKAEINTAIIHAQGGLCIPFQKNCKRKTIILNIDPWGEKGHKKNIHTNAYFRIINKLSKPLTCILK